MNAFLSILLTLLLLAPASRLLTAPLLDFSEAIALEKPTLLTPEPIPVTPDQKFLISLTAGATGESTIEENARVAIQVKKGFASLLVIEFFDLSGTKVGVTEVSILSKSPRLYGRVFYPPPASATMKLTIVPAKGEQVELQNLRVSTEFSDSERAAINPHPTFEFGNLCNYGFALGYGGGVYTRPDGKTVLNTGFAGTSPMFPVKAETYYEVYCQGIPHLGRKSSILLQCFGEDSKKPLKSMRVNVSQQGATTKLLLPAKTMRANFLFYHVILEELRVMESSRSERPKTP
jgi:hypothetical protein